METTICFLNDKILVTLSKVNGKRICIMNYKMFELNEGSIINGVITNSYSIKEALKEIKSNRKLYRKNVSIIIDSSLIFTKKAVSPRLSVKKMEIFVENEFVGLDSNNSEMMFDYSIINKKGKKNKITDVICYAAEKSLVKSFLDIFSEVKMPIAFIDISTNCIVKYTREIESLEDKTYVIANVDGNNISLILFVDNMYYYSTRSRLLSDEGTEDYYQEISSQVSSIVQFNKSQRNGYEIEDVYIFGLTEEESSFCNRYISDLGVSNSYTNIFDRIIKIRKKLDSFNSKQYLYNIGSLFRK